MKRLTFAAAFASVSFAVLDRTAEQETYRAFAEIFVVGSEKKFPARL